MAQEIDAVTVPELPDGPLLGGSLIPFWDNGQMKKTTVNDISQLVSGNIPAVSSDLSKAKVSLDGTSILDIYDQNTRSPFNAVKTTVYRDGSAMTDAKTNGITYFKVPDVLGGGYAKRNNDEILTPESFGAKGDGSTNDTVAWIAFLDALRGGDFLGECSRYAVYKTDVLTVPTGVRLNQNGAKLSFIGTTAYPYIQVTGNNVSWLNISIEAPETQQRQLQIDGDNFYSNSIVVNGGYYAIDVHGNKCVIDSVLGTNNGYATLRLFSDVKAIDYLNISKFVSLDSKIKGFVHNGAFPVTEININDFFYKTEATIDGSNSFLIDPDQPVDTKTVKSVNINNFYCKGSQAGAIKTQNLAYLNIQNFFDDLYPRAYGSSYSIATINTEVYIANIKTYDRISFSNTPRVKIGKVVFTENNKTTDALIRFTGVNAGILEIDSLITEGNATTTTGYLMRIDKGTTNISSVHIKYANTPLKLAAFITGNYPGMLTVGDNIITDANIASLSDRNKEVRRNPRAFITSGQLAPTSGAWIKGDIQYLDTPVDFLGWVCTVSGTPGTWKKFAAIGDRVDFFKPDFISAERVGSGGYDLNTITGNNGFIKRNSSSPTGFVNAPHDGYWVVVDVAGLYLAQVSHIQTAYLTNLGSETLGPNEVWVRMYSNVSTNTGWTAWVQLNATASTTVRGGVFRSAAITGTSPSAVTKTSPAASSIYAQADIQKMVDDITNLTTQLNNMTAQFNLLKANMVTAGQLL